MRVGGNRVSDGLLDGTLPTTSFGIVLWINQCPTADKFRDNSQELLPVQSSWHRAGVELKKLFEKWKGLPAALEDDTGSEEECARTRMSFMAPHRWWRRAYG